MNGSIESGITTWIRVSLVFILFSGPNMVPSIFGQSFTSITWGPPVTEPGAWRSVNWVDYDRDGDLDLFVSRGLSGGQDNVLFRNDGAPGFGFTRMSGLAVSRDHDPSDGSTWADYDNDGNLDLFVVNWYNRLNLLYSNNGDMTFSKVTGGPPGSDGGYSETASWGDYNNDGLVDLYVSNSGGTRLNFLYKNMGGGSFARIMTGAPVADNRASRGVNWVDIDDDGDLDLFVANEENQNENLYRNMLVESGVDTFASVTGDTLLSSGGSSWSGSWADYDNDGDQDVFVANWNNQASRLFLNDGTGSFSVLDSGEIVTDLGFGASGAWGDIDNDGDQDLVVTHAYSGWPKPNYLYLNNLIETDTATLTRITTGPLVTDLGFIYGASWGDYDGDGDLDLFVARTQNESQVNAFYRNGGNANHWLTLDLGGTTSNAAAIGAKIRIKALIGGNPVWQLRVIEGQSGYCGQNLQAHFGLGDAATIDSLLIEWPSGNQEVFTGVAADRHLVIVENDSTPITRISPANGYLNDSPELLLTWNRPLYFGPYRLQVGTDSTFSGSVVHDTLVGGDTTVVIRVEHDLTRYYWRVVPARSVYGNMWSTTGNFDNAILAPGVPVPLAPAHAGEHIPIDMVLQWNSAERATSYRVRLDDDSLLASPLVDTVVTDTILAPPTLGYMTDYFWTVQGVNFADTSAQSAVRDFTTIIEAPVVPVHSLPADDAYDQAADPSISWFPADRAATYHWQLDDDSLFSYPRILEDTVGTDSVVANGLGSLATYFWRVRSLNAGGQSSFSGPWKFRTRLATPDPIEPAEGSSQFTAVSFRWGALPLAEGYHLQYGRDSTFGTPDMEDSTLTDTSLAQNTLLPGFTYYWRIRARHPESISLWSEGTSFSTTSDTFFLTTTSPWTLVSVPGIVEDPTATVLYPDAVTDLFSFSGAYEQADTLVEGKGYWVKMPPSTEVAIAGTRRRSDTIGVAMGWNLVGALSDPVAVSDVATIPGGMSSSGFYSYDGAYQVADSLRPGRGYWVKVDQAGQLMLSSTTVAGPENTLSIRPSAEPPPAPPLGETPGKDILPAEYALDQNYPNPFNPLTVIPYQLPVGGDVSLIVYNPLGERVATIFRGHRNAGYHLAEWNAAGFTTGLYIYRIVAPGFSAVRKMLLLK